MTGPTATNGSNGIMGHRKKESWYKPASPPSKQIVGKVEDQDVDLDDAFNSGDEEAPQPFTLGHNTLKRESIGGGICVEPTSTAVVLNDSTENVGDSGPGEEAQMDEVDLNAPEPQHADGKDPKVNGANERPHLSLRRTNSWREHPPSPPMQIQEQEPPPTPMTPSIVISREGSPDFELQAPRFVNISLDAPNSRSPSVSPPRSPIPRPIYVPPRSDFTGIEAVQSPGTPSARPGSAMYNHPNRSKPNLPPALPIIIPPSPTESQHPDTASHTPNTASRHKFNKSTGISTQDVISKTRPTHLPPKSKEEDLKHMKDWEEMMQRARVADEKRLQAQYERRIQREKEVEESAGRWEREILPNWKAAARDPNLRKLWWKGIPTKLRGRVWFMTLGNTLALSKDAYRGCSSRARRAISSGSFPAQSMKLIEEDILQTLPALHLFHPETGPMYQDLKDLLCAWVVARSDEGLSYVRGASAVAAMFIINMPAEQAFVAMRNMLERHCLRAFYGGPGTKEDVEAYYRIFDTLLADGMPKVYFNFKQHTIPPSEYLRDWLLTVFLNHLPFEVCARIWDVLILEGDSFLFKAAIGILGVIESRLFFPDRKELLEVLHGENKAALEAARRSGTVSVDLMGARYEQYGMTEETLWSRIEGMDEWWKESTWSRLIQRELPDL